MHLIHSLYRLLETSERHLQTIPRTQFNCRGDHWAVAHGLRTVDSVDTADNS